MSFLGILAVLFGLLGIPYACRNGSRREVAIVTVAAIVHILASYVFYRYIVATGGDSDLYYYDEYRIRDADFRFGTVFMAKAVQGSRITIGGTYLDYFLIFQAIGFFGIATLYRLICDLYAEFREELDLYAYAVLFLPTLQFWTSSLGKDPLLFTGAVLTLWAAYRIRTRYLAFALGILLALLIRPYIVLAMVAAVALSALTGRQISLAVRGVLLIACIGIGAVMLQSVQHTYNVDISTAQGVGDFFTTQQDIHARATGYNVVYGSFAFKLLSILARPFFVDAEGFFGIATSFENIVLVWVYVITVSNIRQLTRIILRSSPLRYLTMFTLILMIVLASTYYNVGLGLRQRAMFLPGILCLFLVARLIRKAQRQAQLEGVSAYVRALPPA